MSLWEYKKEFVRYKDHPLGRELTDPEDWIIKAGLDGWELIQIIVHHKPEKPDGRGSHKREYYYKRPIKDYNYPNIVLED